MSGLEPLEIAGVPLLLCPPVNPNRQTPLIVFWHGFASPKGEADIAEVFPLEQVDAWKAYLGLPLFSQRSIGDEALMRRLTDDYVLQLLLPVVEQAAQELPKVVEGLRLHCNLDSHAPLGLFGFSAGGLTALLTLAESQLSIQAVVLAGVTKNLASVVTGYERFVQASYETLKAQYPELKPKYAWSEKSQAAKNRLDFVAHSKAIAQREPLPAILFLHGVEDEVFNLDEIETLHHALKTEYQQINHPGRISLKIFQHLRHAIDLASNSSPAQRADIAKMASATTDWFKQYL